MIIIGELIHEALLYASDDELVQAVVPFLRQGLALGGAAVAAVTRPNLRLLRGAMGRDVDAVRFIDRDEWYVRPTSTLARWKALLDDALDRGHDSVRIVGEVNFGAEERHPSWTRYESAINEAFRGAPAWIVCPYDRRALPASIVDSATCTHPGVMTGADRRESAAYVSPERFLTTVVEPMTAIAGDLAIRVPITGTVASIRRMVRAAATAGGWLGGDRVDDLLLALTEVINNAVRHGRGEGVLWVWAPGTAVVCEVTDEGPGPADSLVGYRPPDDRSLGGMGLWVARQVCDQLTVENRGGLTRVRFAIS